MKWLALAICVVGGISALTWGTVEARRSADAITRSCIESGGQPGYTWNNKPLCERSSHAPNAQTKS